MARTPFIAQMEAAECGAACLAMVLAHFGHDAPLSEVRAACGASRDGTTAVALVRAAQTYGLVPTAHRVELEDLAQTVPAILHWVLDHFVVLVGVSKRGLELLDPAFGPRLVSLAAADEAFSGVRLSFVPGERFRKRRRRTESWARYASLWRAVPQLTLAAFAALSLELLGLIFPVLSQVAIDFVVRPKQPRFLLALGVVLIGATVLRFGLAHARNRILAGVRIQMNAWLVTAFVEHMLRLPLEFFVQRSAGDLASRVEGHAVIRDAVKALSVAGLDGLLIVSYTLMMLAYSPPLAAVAIGVNLVRIALVALMQALVRDAVCTEVVAASREATILAESFTAPEAVKAFAMEGWIERRYADAMVGRLNASGRREQTRRTIGHLLPVLDGLGLSLIYAVGGRLVAADQLTIGVLSAFVAMSALLTPPISSLVGAASMFPEPKQVLRRLDDIWQTPAEPKSGEPVNGLAGQLAVIGVSVRYGAHTVLREINLKIEAGERVVIVGPSGSGKSTLLQVLGALLIPTHGELWLDGKPASRLSLDDVRARIGSVPPEVLPVEASVLENIALGCGTPPVTEVVAAARAACIHDEITALPDGYETQLRRSGVPLSGGQNQRIGLARALLKRPDVLLLDEATSSLDAELEQRIFSELRGRNCTQVLVTHRISAMRSAERVIVMDGGQIVDQGPFEQLSQRCALLRRMLLAQREVSL